MLVSVIDCIVHCVSSSLILQLNQDLEQDESRSYRHPVGSPITNSPPGNFFFEIIYIALNI